MGQLATTWQHLRRSPYQAMAAIMIMFFTCLVASSFVVLGFGFDRVLTYFESKPQTTAFLKDEAKEDDINSIKEKLINTGFVANIKFISKEDALNIYREQNKNDPLLLEMVSSSILPASLEISAKNLTELGALAEIVKKEPLVEDVVYQKDIISTLMNWTSSVRKVGAILTGFLVLVSVVIILMVIGMKIAIRKEEIEILRLVGASKWYIRGPFIAEGAFYGVTGAVLAWGTTYLLLLYFSPFLSTFLTGIISFPVPAVLMLYLLGILSAGGIMVGIFGSSIAVMRYLKN